MATELKMIPIMKLPVATGVTAESNEWVAISEKDIGETTRKPYPSVDTDGALSIDKNGVLDVNVDNDTIKVEIKDGKRVLVGTTQINTGDGLIKDPSDNTVSVATGNGISIDSDGKVGVNFDSTLQLNDDGTVGVHLATDDTSDNSIWTAKKTKEYVNDAVEAAVSDLSVHMNASLNESMPQTSLMSKMNWTATSSKYIDVDTMGNITFDHECTVTYQMNVLIECPTYATNMSQYLLTATMMGGASKYIMLDTTKKYTALDFGEVLVATTETPYSTYLSIDTSDLDTGEIVPEINVRATLSVMGV